MIVVRWLVAWVLAVLVTAATSSVFQSQFNIARIAALDEPVSLRTRLEMTLFDLVSFAPTYAIIVALGLVIAFVVAGLLTRRRTGAGRAGLFALAGAVAIGVALWLMSAMLPVTVISAARSTFGFVALCLAGALGGWLHAAVMARGVARQRQNGQN